MLSEFLLNLVLTPINSLLELIKLPVVNPIEIPDDIYNTMRLICQQAGYLLPIRLFVSILIFDFAVDHFHALWNFILKIKSVLT